MQCLKFLHPLFMSKNVRQVIFDKLTIQLLYRARPWILRSRSTNHRVTAKVKIAPNDTAKL